ncbi:MAG: redox-regulated ATPase YchF [Patescibacteria group bacterium]
MSLRVGIVGLPNVGKSTLFTALTKKQVDCANYPFCTIEPNVGMVKVPDERLGALARISHSEKIIATAVEFVDIAGLVRGAHEGQGLGNKFLSHIREVDAIVQVVRAFENKDIVHVEGRVDPRSDAEVVNLELIFADLATVEKRLDAAQRELKAGVDREKQKRVLALEKVQAALAGGKLAREAILTPEEMESVRELQLLTMKPMLYVMNVDEAGLKDAGHLSPPVDGYPSVVICAKLEAELAELSETEVKEYLEAAGIPLTGLDQLIVAAYKLLDLITFLTSGEKETRAWTVRRGATAPQAAGVIHSDFEKGFIRAEVINWKDFVESAGEAGAREKGLARLEGKEYVVKDGDVCHFRFSV